MLGAAAAWGVLALLWRPCLPFVLAWLTAALLQKPLRWLEMRLFESKQSLIKESRVCKGRDSETKQRVKIKVLRRLLSVLFVLVLAAAAVTLPAAVVAALYDECGRFFAWIGDNLPAIADRISVMMAAVQHFVNALPLQHGIAAEQIGGAVSAALEDMLPQMLGNAAAWLSSRLTETVTAVVRALPGLLLFLAVYLIAAVTMTTEYDGFCVRIRSLITNRCAGKIRKAADAARRTLCSMMRTYLLLGGITCGMLYLGLRILGVDWALGAAVLGAVIDLLPVLGVGTLLLPWALMSYLTGRAGFGTGLLVLYAVICMVRQILEPKLIGKTTGLHPLSALFAMYAGMRLFGLAGLFLVPFAAAVIRDSMGWGARVRDDAS